MLKKIITGIGMFAALNAITPATARSAEGQGTRSGVKMHLNHKSSHLHPAVPIDYKLYVMKSFFDQYNGQFPEQICVTQQDFNKAISKFDGLIEKVSLNENRPVSFSDISTMVSVYSSVVGEFNNVTNAVDKACLRPREMELWFSDYESHVKEQLELGTTIGSESFRSVVINQYDDFVKNLGLVNTQLADIKQALPHELLHYLYGSFDLSSDYFKGIFEDPLYEGPSKQDFKKIIINQYLGQGYSDERMHYAQQVAALYTSNTAPKLYSGDWLKFAFEGNSFYPDSKSDVKNSMIAMLLDKEGFFDEELFDNPFSIHIGTVVNESTGEFRPELDQMYYDYFKQHDLDTAILQTIESADNYDDLKQINDYIEPAYMVSFNVVSYAAKTKYNVGAFEMVLLIEDFMLKSQAEIYFNEMFVRMADTFFTQREITLTSEETAMFKSMKYDGVPIFPDAQGTVSASQK